MLLYNISMFRTNNAQMADNVFAAKGKKRYEDSLKKGSKIIRKTYKEQYDTQSISEYSDDDEYTFDDNKSNDSYNGISQTNHMSVIEKMDNITNNRKYERNKYTEKNTWINQLEPMKFGNNGDIVSQNNINGSNDMVNRVEIERQMEMNGGYSMYDKNDDGAYGVINPVSQDFIHQNMEPFFKKGPDPINEDKRNMVNEMKLNSYTGSDKDPRWKPKIERAPLFSPLVNAKDIYGDPVRTDEYESRVFPGREKRNELPFQQTKITPGLNIGYNTIGKQGFQEMYRAVPKAAYTDQLRTVNNPKVSYGSYVGVAHKGNKGAIMGSIRHKKPQTYGERGRKDLVRSRATTTAPTIYGEIDPKDIATVNRGVDETLMVGPAQHYTEGNTPQEFRGNYRESTKQTVLNDLPRNVLGVSSVKGQGHNNQAYVPDSTQRDIYGDKNMLGHAHNGGVTNKSYAIDYDDIPDILKRNVHDKFDRAGNVKGNKEQQVNLNYDDIPDVTKRELTTTSNNGFIKGNKEQYVNLNYNDIPDITKRETTSTSNNGFLKGNKEQQVNLNYNDVPDITKREMTSKSNNGFLKGNKEQQVNLNYNDIPDITKREMTSKSNNGFIKGNKESKIVINWNDIPDITKRETTSSNVIGTFKGNKESQIAINWNDIPEITKREITSKEKLGNIKGNKEQYIVINWDDIPEVTKREIHNIEKKGTAKSIVSQQGSRQQYMSMLFNGAKEALNQGRAPTKIGMNKGWTIDHTAFFVKEPLEYTWRPSTNSSLLITNDRVNFSQKEPRNVNVWENDRIDSYSEENLENNPYVNNLVHKAKT